MPSTVTTAGNNFIATAATGVTPLSNGRLADQILLAYIDGLDTTSTPPADEQIPAQLADTVAITQYAAPNNDLMLFTALLEAAAGDYQFNWVGLYNSEHDVLIQVSYEPIQSKIATSGQNIGTVQAKTMALQLRGAAAVFDLQTPAQSWQLDFTGRQKSAEDIQRAAMRGVYGSGSYVLTAGAVTKGASVYQVAPGAAMIDGLRVQIPATDTAIAADNAPENYPFYIYATVAQSVTAASVENTIAIETSQTPLDNHTDQHGQLHARVLLATLDDENTITDTRENVLTALTIARAATTTTPGLVALSSAINSTSETVAATPAAVKIAKDAADTAQATATAAGDLAATKLNSGNTQFITFFDDVDTTNGFDLSTLEGGYPGDGFYLVNGDLMYIGGEVPVHATGEIWGGVDLMYIFRYKYEPDSKMLYRYRTSVNLTSGTADNEPHPLLRLDKII